MSDKRKFTVAVTFEIDVEEWRDEYDLKTKDEAAEDIRDAINRAITEGALAEVIVAQWPMMRDAATVTVTPPAGTDWSRFLSGLTREEVQKLLWELDEIPSSVTSYIARKSESIAVPKILAEIAKMDHDGATPKVLIFTDVEWDNGYFLSPEGELFYTDGSSLYSPFSDEMRSMVERYLGDSYGEQEDGGGAGLAIEIPSGRVHHDDDVDKLYRMFGISAKD